MSETDERRDAVLAAIVSAGVAGVSGEAIAAQLGCSRAAIHRHVAALRRAGVAIVGEHGGYVLGDGADPIAPALIESRRSEALGGPVVWSATTGSTNDDAARAARAGAPAGLVIGADAQTAGRGRRGRAWIAAPGDALTFSVVLRPRVSPIDAALLPLVVAVAVAEALGPDARIAWPNDIVVHGRKVCGILCESSTDETGVAWAVAGIGLNVRGAPTLTDARWTAGALDDGRSRAEVLLALLDRLGDRYRQWLDQGAAPIVAAYAERDLLAGRGVTVALPDGALTGTGAGIDDLGRLRVIGPAGEQVLGSGEVVRVEWDD